jgi:hypothetical protein
LGFLLGVAAWGDADLDLRAAAVPNGRLPSPRWRLVAWVAASALVARVLAIALMSGPLLNHPVAANPLGISHAGPVLRLAEGIGLGLFAVAAACSVASVLARFRRGTQQEWQQLKWLAYALAVVLLAFALAWVPVTTPVAEVLLLGALPASRSPWESPSSDTACSTSTCSSTGPWPTRS